MRICIGGDFCFNYSFAPQEGQNFPDSGTAAPQAGQTEAAGASGAGAAGASATGTAGVSAAGVSVTGAAGASTTGAAGASGAGTAGAGAATGAGAGDGKIIDSAAILIVQLRKPGLNAVDRKVVRQLGQIKEVHIAEIAVYIVQIIAVAQIKLRNA